MTSMKPEAEFELVDTDEKFLELETPWRALYAASSEAGAMLRWEWISAWWRLFGSGAEHRRLRIGVMKRTGQVAAILPLYAERGRHNTVRLRFISCSSWPHDGVFPEYLDLLEPDRDDPSGERLCRFVLQQSRWDILMLERLRKDSPLLAAVRGLASAARPCRHSSMRTYLADLSSGFEAYLERRSANSRSRFRRLLRQYDRSGAVFTAAASRDELRRFFSELVDLHQKHWTGLGQAGAFHSSALRTFHETMLDALQPDAEVVITRLADASGAVALIYGFIAGTRFEFYQSGILDPAASSLRSPGILAHLLTMRYLAAKGIRTYDFLAGESDYKRTLATGSCELPSVSLYRPAIPLLMEAAHSAVRRLSHHGV